MILKKEKLREFEADGTVWEYETESGEFVYFAKKENLISVGKEKYWTTTQLPKVFPKTFYGFNDATKYFEELIFKSENKNQKPENNNPQPPIGFLNINRNYSVGIVMQDGRKTYVELDDQISINANVLTFNKRIITDTTPFETTEKYYVDIIGDNPYTMAIYPYQDLEDKNFERVEEVNAEEIKEIQEGKDPYNQKHSELPDKIEDSEEKEPLSAISQALRENQVKTVLNNTFGQDSFEELLSLYGGKSNLYDEILKMTDEEFSAITWKLPFVKDSTQRNKWIENLDTYIK